MPLNEKRSAMITVECMCNGRMNQCPKCNGEGSYQRRSCPSCGGTGKVAEGSQAKCPSCRGQGINPLDDIHGGNTISFD